MQAKDVGTKGLDHRAITLLDKWRFVMQAIPDKRLAAGDLRCLVSIADCYNSSKGRAWPSYSYISRKTGLSRSAVARSVGKLHALSIIHKVSGGTGRANTYRPAFRAPPVDNASPETGDISVTHVTDAKHEASTKYETTPVSHTTLDPSHSCDTIPLNPRSISVGDYRGIPTVGGAARAGGALRPTSGGAPANAAFEDFWTSYPKREGRKLAKQAYDRLVADGVAPDDLVAKARQYAAAKAEVDPKWLKMPANWLKEECWLEDPQPRAHGSNPPHKAKSVPEKKARARPKQAKETHKGRANRTCASSAPITPKAAPAQKLRPRIGGESEPSMRRVEKAVDAADNRTNLRHPTLAPTPQSALAAATATKLAVAAGPPQAEKPSTSGAIAPKVPKPMLAFLPQSQPIPHSMTATWFEPGETVDYGEMNQARVIRGSEFAAQNGGKVLIELVDQSGENKQLLVGPAELQLTRIWHPKHGLGRFLFEDAHGELCVVFEDRDGSSHVKASELRYCIAFDPKSLVDCHDETVRHPKLGTGTVVGKEETGKLIVVFNDKKPAIERRPNSRRPLSIDDAAATIRVFVEAPRSVNIERVLQDYFNVQQPSDIPAEPLAELMTKIGLDEKGIAAIRTELLDKEISRQRVARGAHPGAPELSFKDTLLQCAEGRMTLPGDVTFIIIDHFCLKQEEDMQSERLAKMLASVGLDAEGTAAIKKQLWSVVEMFS